MDRGAWWASVHGVAKSRTRLSDFTFHSSMYKSAVILFLSSWLFGLVLSPVVVLLKFIQVCISQFTLDLGYLLLSAVLGYPQVPNPFNNHEFSECWALLKKTQTCQTQEIIQIWWCPSTIEIMLPPPAQLSIQTFLIKVSIPYNGGLPLQVLSWVASSHFLLKNASHFLTSTLTSCNLGLETICQK